MQRIDSKFNSRELGMIIYRCDACKQITEEKDINSFIIFLKGAARSAGTKAKNKGDICNKCFEKIFGG